MKIVLVNTRHFPGGGDSTYTFNLAELLRKHGHEVAFFAMQDERNIPDPNADLFVTPIDFRTLNKNKSLSNALRVIKRVIYSTEARKRMDELLDRFQPDIVHLQTIHAHITPSVILSAKRKRIPVIWTLHDFKLICPNTHFLIDTTFEICEACGRGRYYQPILKRCKKGSILASGMAGLEAIVHRWMRIRRKVDYFIAPSAFLRNKMIERGFPGSKLMHIPNFLPEENFRAETGDGGYLLFLGRLEKKKGVDILIKAAERAPSVRVVLAGSLGEEMPEDLASQLPPNVSYVGTKYGAELQELLGGARALVLPSCCYENQPYSILEAFAAAKPVIGSDLGGISELVKNRERGLLVPPKDDLRLSEAMQWMGDHANIAEEMGQAARRYALSEHGAQSHYKHIIRIYSEAS